MITIEIGDNLGFALIIWALATVLCVYARNRRR